MSFSIGNELFSPDVSLATLETFSDALKSSVVLSALPDVVFELLVVVFELLDVVSTLLDNCSLEVLVDFFPLPSTSVALTVTTRVTNINLVS